MRPVSVRSSPVAADALVRFLWSPPTRVAPPILMKQGEEIKKIFFEISFGFKIIENYFLSSASYNLSGCGLPLLGDIEQMLD